MAMKTLPYQFEVGDRVQLHPAMDLWMRGAKFGTVVGRGFKRSHDGIQPFGIPVLKVRLDATGKTVRIFQTNLLST